MNFSTILTTRNILILVLLHALALKLTGLSYGLPHAFRADEESILGGALRMLELKTVIPALHPTMVIMNYPPYLPYIYMVFLTPVIGALYVLSGFPDMDTFKIIIFENMGVLFYTARFSSVLISLATIWVTYKISKLVFKNEGVALFAALIQSLDFISNFTSHFARHWNGTTLTIWLAVYFSLLIANSPTRKDYILTGLTSGFGFGISYSFGGLGIFAGGVAHLYQHLQKKWPWKDFINRDALYLSGTFLFLACLAMALHPSAVLRLIVGNVAGLDEAKSIAGWLEAIAFYMGGLADANPLLLVLSVAAIVLLLIQRRTNIVIWGVGILLFYLTILYITVTPETRYIIVAAPLLATASGYVLHWLIQHPFPTFVRILTTGLVVTLISYPLVCAWYENVLLSRDDTREQGIAWLEANLPEDARIVFDLNGAFIRPSHEALLEQKQIEPSSLNAHSRTLLQAYENKNEFLDTPSRRKYHAIHTRRFTEPMLSTSLEGEFLNFWKAKGYEYYAIEYSGELRNSDFHKVIRAEGERLAIFRPAKHGDNLPTYLRSTALLSEPVHSIFQFGRFGPIVEIYRIAKPSNETSR